MNRVPTLNRGNSHSDDRGVLHFNNEVNIQGVKRIYFVENIDTNFIRGWQGHQVEQRWFSAVQGSFKISTMAVDNWENPSKNSPMQSFILNASSLDVLHIPNGYITCIQSLENSSRLMAMSDYLLNEINDEYRFESAYFNK